MRPKKNILCIDANPIALSVMTCVLESKAAYNVFATSNADEAYAMAHLGIDLILCEYGSASVDELKAEAPSAPLILISQRRKNIMPTRAELFLPRGSYTMADLLERMRVMLVRKRGPKKGWKQAPA